MNLRAPQTLVGVDIANAAQYGLVEQQGLDARAARADSLGEILRAYLQRISAKICELVGKQRAGEIRHASEAAGIGVAQLAAVIEPEPHVGVFCARLRGSARRKLPGHSQVNQERRRRRISISRPLRFARRSGEAQKHEFSVALDGFDLPSGKMLLKSRGIIDKVGLAQNDRHNTPAYDSLFQPAHTLYTFRKF